MKFTIRLTNIFIILFLFFSTTTIVAAQKFTNQKINIQTSNLFLLLSSEILLTKGYIDISLANYYKLLQQTQQIQIAERAAEIALDYQKKDILEKINDFWKSYHKGSSTYLDYLTLSEKFIAQNNYPAFFKNAEKLLSSSDLRLQNQIFNSFISLLINDSSASVYADKVHQLAKPYPNNINANIADIIYSASAKNKMNTLSALKRFHEQTSYLDNRITILIKFLNHLNLDYLNTFFQNLEPQSYHKEWIPIYIEQFLLQQKYEEAFLIITKALTVYPSTALYMQAGFISAFKKEKNNIYNQYFIKAYELANDQKKSSVATFAAAGAILNKNRNSALEWIKKIKDPIFNFDKLIMQAIIARNENNVHSLSNYLNQIELLNKKSGVIYSSNDYAKLKLIQIENIQNSQKALKELEKLEHLDNSISVDIQSLILNFKSRLYAEKFNNYQEAEAASRRAVQLIPNAINLNTLGYMLLYSDNQNKKAEALIILKKAYQMEPNSAEILDSLGWAYILNNQIQEGLIHLEKSYQKNQLPEIGAHLAYALWISGNQKEAKNLIKTIQKKHPNHPEVKRIIKLLKIPKTEKLNQYE